MKEGNRSGDRNHATHDVHQVAINIVRPEKLGQREGDSHNEDGGKYFKCFSPAHHGPHQPERHNHRGKGQDAADGRAEIGFRQSAYGSERMDRYSDRAPSHRRCVRNQVKRGSMKRPEAEADHERPGDRDRRAESGGAFNERAKTECHQQNLQTPIGCNSGDRFFHDFKLPGLDGNVVEINRSQHDPGNLQQPECNPVSEAHGRQGERHFEEYNRHGSRGRGAGNRAPVWLDLQTNQQPEQDEDRKSRNQGRKPPAAERVVDLSPLHGVAHEHSSTQHSALSTQRQHSAISSRQ